MAQEARVRLFEVRGQVTENCNSSPATGAAPNPPLRAGGVTLEQGLASSCKAVIAQFWENFGNKNKNTYNNRVAR